ncbi:MAG: M43 family zinc metalloprotease [Crocinitomicaceae bacterium]|nr:M43 family zinc metalloprotease [Crocinitomicaceae bacterium]MDG1776469.1 M43 family zinc metalloprotease [Crocinitomicaceae bacterium]
MNKLITLLSLCLLVSSTVLSQVESTRKCGTYEALQQAFEIHPELEQGYEAHQLLMNSYQGSSVGNSLEKADGTYTIPVVFHILHNYGTENISDAQVYDALKVFNREFNAADPDSVDIMADFDTLIGNANIEFKLAAIDPLGNCTNGIEHIYTHETYTGDAYAKIHQWNRANYLNIWVVKVVGTPGAAAYAMFPASTDGNGYWLDGVVSNHTYVGSIGTSSTYNESTLTHEIGHWLSLAHTFGDSDLINVGPTICNDDGIADTPVTKGHQSCPTFVPPYGWADCDPLINEDLQNYMDYSYCDRHFSPGQALAMNNTLEGIAGQRNNLWKDSTLIATGVKDLLLPQDPANTLTVPLCVPVADFTSNKTETCIGSPVSFSNASWNAVIDGYAWTFQDGVPATSTLANPSVSFTTPGYKTVTLSASNATGTGTETRTGYIYVSLDYASFDGPNSIDLEGPSAQWFVSNNLENNHGEFALSAGTGYNNSTSYKLNNFKDVSGADLFNDDFFYNNRLGGSVDELITPSFDLRYTTGVTMSFKFSYATNGTQVDQITEKLKVYASTNCGESWVSRTISIDGTSIGGSNSQGISGANIVTGGYAGYSDYTPTSNNDWKTGSVSINTSSAYDKVIFKFEFTASDVASNFYVDNINVNGTLGLVSDEISALDLSVYPNPSNGEAINVNYTAQDEAVTFILRDTQGKILSSETLEQTNTVVNHSLNNSANLPAACYFLEIKTGEHTTTKKVVVL